MDKKKEVQGKKEFMPPKSLNDDKLWRKLTLAWIREEESPTRPRHVSKQPVVRIRGIGRRPHLGIRPGK